MWRVTEMMLWTRHEMRSFSTVVLINLPFQCSHQWKACRSTWPGKILMRIHIHRLSITRNHNSLNNIWCLVIACLCQPFIDQLECAWSWYTYSLSSFQIWKINQIIHFVWPYWWYPLWSMSILEIPLLWKKIWNDLPYTFMRTPENGTQIWWWW